MSNSQTIAAIDIGTTKIVAIVGTRDESGKVKVLGYGEAPSKGVVRGSVQNVGAVSAGIKEAVRKCREFSGVDFKNVFVGIAGQNIRTIETRHSKFISNQIISQTDIDELTQEVYNLNKESGEEIIHVIPKAYTVDNSDIVLNPVGCTGKSLGGDFYVVIGRANGVQKLRQAMDLSGLNVVKIVLQSIASADAVLNPDDKERGTLVADIGAGTTDVAIYQDNVLRRIAVIPFGGNAITNDIKSATQLIFRQAEDLKVKYAAAYPEPSFSKTLVSVKDARSSKEISLADLTVITKARAEEIVAGIAHVLNESGYASRVSLIAITGGGARLKSLPTLVKYCLGKDVDVMVPRNFVAEACPKLFNVEYSTSVGLLVKGIEYMEKFFESMERKKKEEAKAENAGQKSAKDGDGKSKTDKKDDKKEEKKPSGFMAWVTDKLKTIFSDDADTSRL